MNVIKKMTPFGILEVMLGQLMIIMGTSKETSDFIIDALQIWWDERKEYYPSIEKLVINLDNGPSVQSHRTQFIKRMIEFSMTNHLQIHLIYYPPYHSKYNPIEHCWGALERHWNGTILESTKKAIEWAKTMSWKGINPIVHLLDGIYQGGIKLTKKEMEPYENKIIRLNELPKWDVFIDFTHSE